MGQLQGGNFIAAGTILTSQFVSLTSGIRQVVASGANDANIIGISQDANSSPPQGVTGANPQNAAVSGQALKVFTVGDECLLRVSGTVTAGNRLAPDANGNGTPVSLVATTVSYFGAIALENAVAGELCNVQVLPGSITGT